MNGQNPSKLVIGVLGMPDNPGTGQMLAYLTREAGIDVDFVVYWDPSPREQWKRVVRKIKAAGVGPALSRAVYALVHRGPLRSDRTGGRQPGAYREYHVPGHNSPECAEILQRERVDVLLLGTDALIGRRILEIPRVVTLNVHPGWVPQHRGLGSNLFQMEAGELPAVSVHAVNEGIDTGPVIVRERVPVDPTRGLDHIEQVVDMRRRELLADVLRLAEDGKLQYVDTFTEPSGMTRGMSARRRKRLDTRLRSGAVTLDAP